MLNPKSPSPRRGIAEVAKRLGVSVATVSMALNDKGRISTKTRSRVLAACRRLDYHPHPGARFFPSLRSLPNAKVATHTLAFTPVFDSQTVGTYLDYLPGMAVLARQEGKAILYQPYERGTAMDFKPTGQFRVDGRILIGLVDDSVIEVFKTEDVPLLVLGDHTCRQPVWNVNSDNLASAQMAIERLWGLGHRRIGLFREPRPTGYQEELTHGMRRELERRGGGLKAEWMLSDVPADVERLRALLRQDERPSAFVAVTQACAEKLLFQAKAAGLDVPRDMDIVVFGLLSPASRLGVLSMLAHIDPGCREMGIRAMDILIRLAEKGDASAPCRTLVQPLLSAPVAG